MLNSDQHLSINRRINRQEVTQLRKVAAIPLGSFWDEIQAATSLHLCSRALVHVLHTEYHSCTLRASFSLYHISSPPSACGPAVVNKRIPSPNQCTHGYEVDIYVSVLNTVARFNACESLVMGTGADKRSNSSSAIALHVSPSLFHC